MKRLAVLAIVANASCQTAAGAVLPDSPGACDYTVTHHSDCGVAGRYTCQCDGAVRPPKAGTVETAYNAMCLHIDTVCDGRLVRSGIPVADGGAP